MERLTDKKEADAQRREYENRLKNGYPRNIPEERFLKLAAYEDTGLEPKEGAQIKLALMGKALAEIKEFEEIPMARMIELAQAEKDGRLPVLPVPVGTNKIAYGITGSDDRPRRIVTIECDYLEKLEIWDNPGREVVVEVDGWEIGKSDIGKTVFLIREDAEAALKNIKEKPHEQNKN